MGRWTGFDPESSGSSHRGLQLSRRVPNPGGATKHSGYPSDYIEDSIGRDIPMGSQSRSSRRRISARALLISRIGSFWDRDKPRLISFRGSRDEFRDRSGNIRELSRENPNFTRIPNSPLGFYFWSNVSFDFPQRCYSSKLLEAQVERVGPEVLMREAAACVWWYNVDQFWARGLIGTISDHLRWF